MIFQTAEVDAPENAGPLTGGPNAGWEVEADAEEGGLGESGELSTAVRLRLVLGSPFTTASFCSVVFATGLSE